jgi:hypothetical protein
MMCDTDTTGWVPDPANVPGRHEDYYAEFDGVAYQLSFRIRLSQWRDRETYGDWSLQVGRNVYAVSGATVDEAMAFANRCGTVYLRPFHDEFRAQSRAAEQHRLEGHAR